MDDDQDIQAVVDGLLEQLSGVKARQDRYLRPLVTELVRSHRLMTAEELSQQPALCGISMATMYRLLSKMNEAGLLRRIAHHSRADLLAIHLPCRRCDFMVCSLCGESKELQLPGALLKFGEEITSLAGWGHVRMDVNVSGLCPECLRRSSEGRTSVTQ